MIAVDTNILVYAFNSAAAEHARADETMRLLTEGSSWGLPWSAVHEFITVVTSQRFAQRRAPVELALQAVDVWVSAPTVVLLSEPRGYWRVLRELATSGHVAGSGIYDARIAATCIAHGVRELWTADRDFGRFPGLRTHNPLVC